MGNNYIDALMKNYRSSPSSHQAPVKKLSDQKRKLVSSGLPIRFYNAINTSGIIYLNDSGDIVVCFDFINGTETNKKCYLIDCNDELIENCVIC